MCSLVKGDPTKFVDGTGQGHLLVPSKVSHVKKCELAIRKEETSSAGILGLVRLLLLSIFAIWIRSSAVYCLGQYLPVRSDYLNFDALQWNHVPWLHDHPSTGRCRQVIIPAVLGMRIVVQTR